MQIISYSVQWISILPGISSDLDTINKYILYHITVRYSKYLFPAIQVKWEKMLLLKSEKFQHC